MMERVRLVVFGLGNRAKKYLSYLDMHPGAAELVAVVEPDPYNRAWACDRYGVPQAACFAEEMPRAAGKAGRLHLGGMP